MKNALHGFISRLDTADKRISELEDISIESSNTKKGREQKLNQDKTKQNTKAYSRTEGQLQNVHHKHNGNTRRRRNGQCNRRYI